MIMIENINTEQLNALMKKIIVKNSSVGVHGAGVRNREIASNTDWNVVYNNILSSGLQLYDTGCEQHGISGHIDMRGKIENIPNTETYIQEYKTFKDHMVCDIIIAIPETIKDINDVIYYLGDYSNEVSGDDIIFKDNERFYFPLNRIKTLPKEFIVGCIVYEYNKIENGVTYYQNENYYGLLSDDKKGRLIDELTLQKAHMLKFIDHDYNIAKKRLDKKYYREFCIKYEQFLKNQETKQKIM